MTTPPPLELLELALTTLVANATGNASLDAAAAAIPDTVRQFRYAGIVIGIIVVIVGSVGNMLTIIAYLTNKKLQTRFNLFIFHLSIVDFVTASLMIPFHLAGYMNMAWPFPNQPFTAKLQAFFYFCCGYVSIDFLVAITINRMMGVLFPGKYNVIFSGTNLKLIIFICYTLAPAFLLPFLFGSAEECPHGLTGFNKAQIICTFICLKGPIWPNYMQVTRVLFQLLPFPLMILVYVVIFWKKRSLFSKFSTIMSRSGSNQMPGFDLEGIAGILNNPENTMVSRPMDEAEKKHNRSNRKLLKISFTICAAFAFVFLPSALVNLSPYRAKMDTRIHMACSNLAWFNSLINPIVYAILNSKFRREYKKIMKDMMRRLTKSSTT